MSPFMAFIVLGILLGTLVCIVAAIGRKRGCALMTLPFPLLILAWVALASVPPNSEQEFDRLFGEAARSAATDIRTIKPTFMDGFLISFRVSCADYTHITAGTFSREPLGGLSFFGRARRPSSWPASLETMDEFDRRDFGEDYILAYYDSGTQTVYASFHYWGW